MSDPRRLTTERAGDLVGILLESARDDVPPRGSHERVLAALGVGAAVGGASTVAGAAAAGPKTITTLAAVAKWIGVGASTAVLAIGSAAVLDRVVAGERDARPKSGAAAMIASSPSTRVHPIAPARHDREPDPPAAADPEPIAEIPAEEPRPAPITRPPIGRAESGASAPNAPASPRSGGVMSSGAGGSGVSQLAREVAALDQIRAALASSNARRALSLLDAYAIDFPGGALSPEARLLRIEALVKAGRKGEAESSAREFLAANPASPHAPRIRRLLEEAPP